MRTALLKIFLWPSILLCPVIDMVLLRRAEAVDCPLIEYLQARLVLDCKANVVYIPHVRRETRASPQALVRQDSFEVVICVHFFALPVLS